MDMGLVQISFLPHTPIRTRTVDANHYYGNLTRFSQGYVWWTNLAVL